MIDQEEERPQTFRETQVSAEHQQDLLDAALDQTFPASDPVSLPSFG